MAPGPAAMRARSESQALTGPLAWHCRAGLIMDVSLSRFSYQQSGVCVIVQITQITHTRVIFT